MIFHNCSQQNTQYMLLNIRQVVVHMYSLRCDMKYILYIFMALRSNIQIESDVQYLGIIGMFTHFSQLLELEIL